MIHNSKKDKDKLQCNPGPGRAKAKEQFKFKLFSHSLMLASKRKNVLFQFLYRQPELSRLG
jgi:hypothetical protein